MKPYREAMLLIGMVAASIAIAYGASRLATEIDILQGRPCTADMYINGQCLPGQTPVPVYK